MYKIEERNDTAHKMRPLPRRFVQRAYRMAMYMNDNTTNLMKMPHNISLEDRRHLTVSGVSDVDSFDEQTVSVFTDLGELTIKGEDLHINRLSLEMGELVVDGEISSLTYTDHAKPQQGSFWGRVFR